MLTESESRPRHSEQFNPLLYRHDMRMATYHTHDREPAVHRPAFPEADVPLPRLPNSGTGFLSWLAAFRSDKALIAELNPELASASRKLLAEYQSDHNERLQKTINALEAMGNAGRLAEAEPLARSMTMRFPTHGFGWKALGISLLEQGRSAEGLDALQRAAVLWPHDSAAHNSLGVALTMEGRLTEAEACCRLALQLDPAMADGYNNLGCTLQRQGRLAESEASFRWALEIDSHCVEAYFNLGTTLAELGRSIEAEACYAQALKIKPDYAKAFVARGIAHSREGRFASAEAMFQRALTINREIPTALMGMASVRKMTSDDVAWIGAAERALEREFPPREGSKLHYALGKYYDDVQDFDRAFLNYQRANELSSQLREPYDRKQFTRLVDQICHVYNHTRVQQPSGGASDSTRPVFIVGMPRSGTSLVEQILASHPNAFGAGELNFWPATLVNNMPAALGGQFDATLLGTLTQSCLDNLCALSPDARHVIDKMPVNFLNLGLIHAAFPNARILHTTRDPIDTCLSIYFQNFSSSYHFANDLADLTHYYREYQRLMAHWRAVLPADVFLDVPYEALVRDQETWSRKLISFIGLEWDPRCLDFHETERMVSTASQWQVRQKMFDTSIARWRNYEKFVGPLLELVKLH